MHDAIQISKLNDFIFSPKSLLYHSIYESFTELLYKDIPQTNGTIAHETIDTSSYSCAKRYLQGIPVYSSKYNIVGKIDIYDTSTKTLIERKRKVKQIFSGYILQLYAQMFCLQEVHYEVRALYIHSLTDNKRYSIPLPGRKEKIFFRKILKELRRYKPEINNENISKAKLDNCIYKIFYA